MGGYIKWTFWIVVVACVAAFLSYVLPQRDIVRITGTEIIRTDFTGWNRIFYAQADSGSSAEPTRDLRLINTARPGGGVMVYRNEDTGLFWPPYFKFDSSDLQAEAQSLISSPDAPKWAVVLHYGWRIRYLTVYPNAITIRPIDDPDVRLIPWVNIAILTFLAALTWGIWVRVRRFKQRRIDPKLEALDDAIDERRAGLSRWIASWKRKG